MTLTMKQQLVAGAPHTFDGTNPCTYITIHETANTSAGADAQAHANLQSRGNVRTASWQWTVDDHEAIQSYLDTARCWHAGDGRGNGNMSSIGIEICVNSDGDYHQALLNAAELVRTLMQAHAIPLSRVVQHNHWSGKNCPTKLRRGDDLTWAQFLALVGTGDASVITPKPPTKPKPPTITGGFDMATLPTIPVRNTGARAQMFGRIQGLLQAAGYYLKYRIDDISGPGMEREFARFQVDHNCGDGKGHADNSCGPGSWESLLTGKKH